MTEIVGSGSISQRHGFADPDPPQNVIDPQHCKKLIFVGILKATEEQDLDPYQKVTDQEHWISEIIFLRIFSREKLRIYLVVFLAQQ
jgi:hypothetical protein